MDHVLILPDIAAEVTQIFFLILGDILMPSGGTRHARKSPAPHRSPASAQRVHRRSPQKAVNVQRSS